MEKKYERSKKTGKAIVRRFTPKLKAQCLKRT